MTYSTNYFRHHGMSYPAEARKALANMRMAQADGFLGDAALLAGHGSLRSAVNRCYYAMFHATSALAINDGCDFRRHTAIISWFDQTYVKTGRLPRELSKALRHAFDSRSDADYGDAITFAAADVEALLEQARQFVAVLKSHLQAS
jgi:hypothetical protein